MRFRLGLAVAAFAVVAFNAQAASASCGYSGTQVFQPWGDTSLYAPLQDSSFEAGAPSWTLNTKASVVSGDSNPLLGVAGSRSVEITGGGSAKSPSMCVDATTPSIRFFVRRTSGTGNLAITGTLQSGPISGLIVKVGTVTGTGSWTPSPVLALPASMLTGSLTARFVFTADQGSTYRIDDVYIDPWHCC